MKELRDAVEKNIIKDDHIYRQIAEPFEAELTKILQATKQLPAQAAASADIAFILNHNLKATLEVEKRLNETESKLQLKNRTLDKAKALIQEIKDRINAATKASPEKTEDSGIRLKLKAAVEQEARKAEFIKSIQNQFNKDRELKSPAEDAACEEETP